MSAPEVDWVLDQVGSVVDAQPEDHPLYRIDRDNSLRYDGGGAFDMSGSIRTRTGELQSANFVGAGWVDRARTPIGTNYDYAVENVVGVRVEGLHHSEFGHVDPAGASGVVFTTLVDDIQDAIDDAATFPSVTGALGSYTDLVITNEAPASAGWADYYRFDFDVVFSGYEERT